MHNNPLDKNTLVRYESVSLFGGGQNTWNLMKKNIIFVYIHEEKNNICIPT